MKQRLFDSFDILIQQQVIMVSECDILNTCVNDYLFEMDNVFNVVNFNIIDAVEELRKLSLYALLWC